MNIYEVITITGHKITYKTTSTISMNETETHYELFSDKGAMLMRTPITSTVILIKNDEQHQ
jgi:hypothetical protein